MTTTETYDGETIEVDATVIAGTLASADGTYDDGLGLSYSIHAEGPVVHGTYTTGEEAEIHWHAEVKLGKPSGYGLWASYLGEQTEIVLPVAGFSNHGVAMVSPPGGGGVLQPAASYEPRSGMRFTGIQGLGVAPR